LYKLEKKNQIRIHENDEIDRKLRIPYRGALSRGVLFALCNFGELTVTETSSIIGWKRSSCKDEFRRLSKESNLAEYFIIKQTEGEDHYSLRPDILRLNHNYIFDYVLSNFTFNQLHPSVSKQKNKKKNGPNGEEIEVLNMLNQLFPNQYKFVGDGALMLGRKKPDFVDNTNTKIIEYFGSRYHKPSDEKKKKEFFRTFNYDTFCIWDYEFKNKKKRKNLMKRIVKFHNEGV